MLNIWARSFLTATRQDKPDSFRWAAPDHWRQPTYPNTLERRTRND